MKSILSSLVLLLIFFCFLYGQDEYFSHQQPSGIFEYQNVELRFNIIKPVDIKQVLLFYRSSVNLDFIILELNQKGSAIWGTIPSRDILSPYVEYFLKIITTDGRTINYPSNVTQTGNYLRIFVSKSEHQLRYEEKIILLNPADAEQVEMAEFFIAFSLLKVSDNVQKNFTRVWINNEDITSLLKFDGDLIYTLPGSYRNLKSGSNIIRILLFDINKNPISTNEYRFDVLSGTPIIDRTKTLFKYSGSTQLESSHENMRNGNFNFNRLRANFSSNYGILNSKLYLYITNEEMPNLQPQNRYLLSLDMDFFKLFAGDHYPVYPSLIMSGKRLRGVTGALEFGFFNLQVSYGEVTRKIEGELLQMYARDSAVIGSNIIPIDSAKFGYPFGKVNLGTYQRKLFAIRPYFGKGRNFQLGFTYLHSKDETGSINFGARPKENLVVGTDLLIGIDDQRILLKAQGSMSILNNDISTGNFTDKLIDSLFGEGKPFGGDPAFIKRVRDIGSKFITINHFIVPLNPQELATLAGEVLFSLNYFGNYLRTSYIYRGNDYTSFGQNFLRNDLNGFQILDRLGLFDNRLFISASFERLNDNLQKTKIATTTFQNFESSVSIYPRMNFPNLTFGYSRFKIQNDIDPFTTDSIKYQSQLNDITNQFIFSSSYDFRYYVQHRIFFNLMTSKKTDYTFRNQSAQFANFSFNVQSFWRKSLQSFFGITSSSSEISNSKYKYLTLNLGGRFISLNDKLKTTFALNPSLGDLKRTIIELYNQYSLTKNFSLNFNLRYLINSKPVKNESIVNLFASYEF